MILELIATGLLAYGVSASSINVNNDNHYNSNDNHICESITPQRAYNSNSITGGYNFRDSFTDLTESDVVHFNCYFSDNNSAVYNTLCYYNGNLYYLEYLSVIQYTNSVSCEFNLFDYDDTSTGGTVFCSFLITDTIHDLDEFKDFYFFVTTPYYMESVYIEQFNRVFTNNDNSYVVSYDGYYSFFSSGITPFTNQISVLGNIVFNNTIYYGLISGSYVVDAISIDYVHQINSVVNNIPYSTSPNIWFNSVKMTKSNYLYMSSVGVFGYTRPTTYDDSTFNDLLFSVMDSPIYMLSRLLNFELFGVNVFIAMTGLLTLALVVVVIRKIW